MTVPVLALADLPGRPAPPAQAPVVVLGPSLGTSACSLWGAVAHRLPGQFRVVGWDLPGHGSSAPTDEHFTLHAAEAEGARA